jgi:hypothetical protein
MRMSSACIVRRVSASSAAERLVHQQDIGVDGERAGDFDPSPHAAGELEGEVPFESPEAGQIEQMADLLPK